MSASCSGSTFVNLLLGEGELWKYSCVLCLYKSVPAYLWNLYLDSRRRNIYALNDSRQNVLHSVNFYVIRRMEEKRKVDVDDVS